MKVAYEQNTKINFLQYLCHGRLANEVVWFTNLATTVDSYYIILLKAFFCVYKCDISTVSVDKPNYSESPQKDMKVFRNKTLSLVFQTVNARAV